MLTSSAALAATLAAVPSSAPTDVAPPDFADRLAYSEVLGGDREVQVVGYDDDGEPIATIALWQDEAGVLHLEMDFDDGYSSTVVVDGREQTDATLPSEVLVARADLLAQYIEEHPTGPLESWFTCGATATLAVAGCHPATAGPAIILTCSATLALALCECAPELGIEVKACD